MTAPGILTLFRQVNQDLGRAIEALQDEGRGDVALEVAKIQAQVAVCILRILERARRKPSEPGR